MGYNGDLYPTAGADVVMTTTGDLVRYNSGARQRLGIGSSADVLTVSGGLPAWVAPASSGTYSQLGTDASTSGASELSVGSFTMMDCVQVYFYGCSAGTTESDLRITLNDDAGQSYNMRGLYSTSEVSFNNQVYWSATLGNNTAQRPINIKIIMWKQDTNIIDGGKVQGFLESANSWTTSESDPAGVNTYVASGIMWNDTDAVTSVEIKHGSDNIIGNLQVNGFDYG